MGSSPVGGTMKKTKYSVVYDDETTTSTWTYDLDRFKNGPISVEIHYKDDLEQPKKKKNYYKSKKKAVR
jgi:hypothetical protein